MFQIPVQNLDNIRRSRKKVKGILVDIGLDSCQELLQVSSIPSCCWYEDTLLRLDIDQVISDLPFLSDNVGQVILQSDILLKKAFTTLKSFDPGEKYFSSTSWNDVSHWDNFAKRKRYRTNPYCCSLCKFSSKFLNAFKNHLTRYHEDEMDQELVVPCPECSFASHSKTVGKHLRMFHSKKKIQNYNVSGGMRQFRNDAVNFVCQKCQFTDMLYYNTKKHVLVSHFQNLISTYFEERPDETEENFTDHYCKKCNAFANSRDSLIYHVLTSEVHKDLENILGSVISVQPKKTGQTKSLQIINIAPKPSAISTVSQVVPTSVGSNSTSRFQLSLPSVNQNQHTVPTKAVHNVAAPLSVSGSASSMTASTSANRLHIALLSGPRPANQNSVGLQPAVSQPVFVSQRFPVKEPVRPSVFCLNQPIGNISRAVPPGVMSFTRPIRPNLLPAGNQSVRTIRNPIMPRPGPIPVNRPSSPGILAVNRPIGSGSGILPVSETITSRVLQFNQPVTPGVLPVNPSATGPGIVQFNQPVTPEVLPVNQSIRPGMSQNATLLTTGPMLRQLIPTGKQVNGIPTYTLAPVSVTLPGTPGGGVATVPPPQVPVQLMPSGPVAQLSQGPATVPSPVAVSSSTNPLTKTSPTSSAMNLVLKQAKQWKTCPVCSELFPSNVYQVHMQVAHKCSTSKTEITREVDKVAACAPFLRWLKDKTVRCFSCKCFLTQAELVKHIFIHGLTCLFCTSVFHDLKCLVAHTRTVHNGKKKLHSDYEDKGFQLLSDSEDHLVFPHFDYSIASKEFCEREVHLVVLAGVNSRTLIPLYIKLQQEDAEMSRENKVSTCPFCYGIFTTTDAYEIHLKERHHIMPTVHTILKSPAFKCIHCCGVYTGNMSLTAIAVHLLRCRSAPKDNMAAMKMQVDLDEKQDLPLVNGENHDDASPSAKRKQSDHLYAVSVSEDQSDEDPPFFIINNGSAQIPVNEVNCVPSKRQKSDPKTEIKGESSVEDLHMLVLNPKPFQQSSNEVQKRFLADYFHKKPYPSKKELELLSSTLCAWKVDVASFFGRKRYFCLKAIKNFKPSVLLGFNMSELKNVKHSLNLNCELEDV